MIDLWNNKKWTPMLLNQMDKSFNSNDHIFELKYDGIRAIIYVSPKEIKIYNRKKQDITNKYPELYSIKDIVKRKTIFDGEIIIMQNGYPSFSSLQERIHIKNKSKILYLSKIKPAMFICFDILYDNKNLIEYSLINRKKILNKYNDNDYFIKSKYIEKEGINLFNTIKKFNLEGIVAKRKNSKYEINKRTSYWLKIKNIKEDNFYICGYNKNKSKDTISIILGEYKNKLLYYVGKVVMSKKHELYNIIINEKIINKSSLKDYNNKNINYIYPTYTCKVNYLEKTKNNHLRHPKIK